MRGLGNWSWVQPSADLRQDGVWYRERDRVKFRFLYCEEFKALIDIVI